MAVIITLDVMLAKRKMKSKDLAKIINVTEANLSKLKSGNVKGVKLETLNKICIALDCKPADLIDFVPDS
ncbi:MAG: helix-turn-helix transcriptional regulator [Hellea sp.]